MSLENSRLRFQDPSGSVWLDGRLVEPREAAILVTDPAIQFGLGVFESLALRAGRALEQSAHVDRLFACAARLGVPLPARAELESAIAGAAAGVEGGCGWLRVIASRSGRCAVFAGRMDPSEEGRSVRAVLLPWRRSPADVLTGLKSLNYAANVLGLEEAERRGAEEGLWLNTRGHLAEGCSSNLFVVRSRAIFTPAERDGILPGIVRGLAIDAARGLGLPIHEGKVRVPRLLRADEAFLTSSTRGVRPLVEFEGKPVGRGRPGPVTAAIAEEVRRLRGIDTAEAARRRT
ncbi:MAG: aminotransferase class IV [Acidobacteriia bacterium]|nr:aminotransferase class IV [Terriglobia bacterium]